MKCGNSVEAWFPKLAGCSLETTCDADETARAVDKRVSQEALEPEVGRFLALRASSKASFDKERTSVDSPIELLKVYAKFKNFFLF